MSLWFNEKESADDQTKGVEVELQLEWSEVM